MFVKKGNGFFYPFEGEVRDRMVPGIYTVSPVIIDYRLTIEIKLTAPEFAMPSTLYDNDEEFVERVVRAYQSRKCNTGVLMNGYRGTGKTVTCKQICNALNLPVFLIPKKMERDMLAKFFDCLDQECVVFIDEYEKQYADGSDLLDVLDGAGNSKCKILFLLTTNSMNINENMLNRPNRLLYIKQVPGLSENGINELLDNLLAYPEHREELLDVISRFEYVTVDNVTNLVQEINLFGCTPSEAVKHLNISIKSPKTKFGLPAIKNPNPEPTEEAKNPLMARFKKVLQLQ
jgi:hypothetical protein